MLVEESAWLMREKLLGFGSKSFFARVRESLSRALVFSISLSNAWILRFMRFSEHSDRANRPPKCCNLTV